METKVAENIYDRKNCQKQNPQYKLDFFAFNVGAYPTVAVRYEFLILFSETL